MKILFSAIALYISVSSIAQNKNISLAGENYLALNGGKFTGKKIVFTKAEGDWFSTGSDAHASLLLYSKFDSRELQFAIEWDGKNASHVITNETRHDGKRTGDFLVTLPDKEVYGDGLNAYPGDNEGKPEEVKITVTAIDDITVQATITGNISSGRDHMKVNGMISLKKNAAPKASISSSYKDCDNIIHDKLVGAENRSATDCEIKFDLELRNALHLSFQPLIDSFIKKGWLLEKETPATAISNIGRGTEKRFYDPGFTNVGDYQLQLRIDPASAEYAKWQQQYESMMEDFKKDPMKPGNMDKLAAFGTEMNAATTISVVVSVNPTLFSKVNFTSGHRVEKPGIITYAVYLKNAQAPTGGGKEDARNTVWLYLGKWSNPKFEKHDDGSERVELIPVNDLKASHLSLQTIVIKMECNDALANEVTRCIDLKKLQLLLQ